MSWSATISIAPGANIPEALDKAREGAKSASVDDAIREARDAAIDAELGCVAAILEAVGEKRTASGWASGHLNPDGSGSIYVSLTLGSPVAATPQVPHG